MESFIILYTSIKKTILNLMIKNTTLSNTTIYELQLLTGRNLELKAVVDTALLKSIRSNSLTATHRTKCKKETFHQMLRSISSEQRQIPNE